MTEHDSLARALRNRLAELEQEIARLDGETTQPLSKRFSDQVHDLEELATNESLEAAHKAEFEQITSALNRLKDGRYGLCASCGADIQPARLEAMPAATLCISCARQAG